MNKDENLKAAVIESCINGTMTVKVAAERLNFSERYVKKLKARYKKIWCFIHDAWKLRKTT